MQTEILVALITAGSALLVASVTGLVQLWQLRANQRRELDFKVEQRTIDSSNKEFREIQHGLREACKAIQRVQDEILLLIKAAPGSLISETQQKNIIRSRDNLLKVYQDHHPVLSDQDRRILDEARKKVVDMILGLDLERIWAPEYLSLEENLTQELERVSIVLGHHHQQLLSSSLHLMNNKLVRVTGANNV